MKNHYTALLLFALILAPLAAAVNRAPTYDYAGGTYNFTCTNSPVYNTVSRSYVFGPSGNQKCDPAANWTTSQLPTNSSPYTELAWINMSAYTPTGSSYHLSNIGFEFATNRGYSHRFEYNSTAGFRGQVVAGGTFNTGSYVGGFTTNTWVPVIYEFTGTNILVYVNGTLSLNASSTGRALNTTGNNQYYGSGTGGGLANGMWNGTVKYHARYNRVLTAAEKLQWYNNETINTTGLVSWHTFENTTGVTATLGSTPLGPMPSHSLGFHGELFLANATLIDANNDGTLDTLADVNQYYNAWSESGATVDRWDMNLDIVCTFTPSGCVWSYTNALNARNMSLHKSNYDKLVELGGKAVFILEATPLQLAINNSDCNYGAGSDWADCESIKLGLPGVVDYSDLVIAAKDYINFMTDDWTNPDGLDCVETHNEPYLRQFWLTNSSVTTQHAITRMLVKHDAVAAGLRAEFPGIKICGPSVTYGSSAAGLEFMHGFYGNRTYGSTNAPDYASTHEYGSSGVMGIVRDNIEEASSILCGLYGYCDAIYVSETLTNNADVSQFNQPRMMAETANAYYGGILSGVQAMHVFRFSDSRPWGPATTEYPAKYPQYYLSQLGGPYYGGGYQGVQRVQYLQNGNQYYNCTASDSSVTCLATTAGDKYYVSFANMKGNQIGIDTLTIPGANILSVEKLTSNAGSVSGSGEEAILGYTNWYGVDTYEITVEQIDLSFNSTSPTSPTNASTAQSPLFTLVLNNPSQVTYTVYWTLNSQAVSGCADSLTCALNAGALGVGSYNVTAEVTGPTNTIETSWTLTVYEGGNACTNVPYGTAMRVLLMFIAVAAGVFIMGVLLANASPIALITAVIAIVFLLVGFSGYLTSICI